MHTLLLVIGGGHYGSCLAEQWLKEKEKILAGKKLCILVDKKFEGMDKLKDLGAHVEDMDFKNINDKQCRKELSDCIKKHNVDYMILAPGSDYFQPKLSEGFLMAWKDAGKHKNVIMMSLAGCDHASSHALHELCKAEECVKKAGDENLILRSTMCMEGLEVCRKEISEKKRWKLPMGQGKAAFVAGCDVLKVLCSVMKEKELVAGNQVITITGPDAVNGEELARASSTAFREDVKFENCEKNQFQEVIENYNKSLKHKFEKYDQFGIEIISDWFELVKNNKLNFVSNDFEKIVHKKPMNIMEFFQENRDDFTGKAM